MDSNTARQHLLNVCGDKEESTGTAITKFVDEAMQENNKSIEALARVYADLSQEVTDMKANVASKSDLDNVYNCLNAVGSAINSAVSAYKTAAKDVYTGSAQAETHVQETKTAIGEANAAVSEARLTLESLNERLETVENWRKNTVDPTLERYGNMLEEHDRWINEQRRQQEHEVSRVPLIDEPPAHDEHENDRMDGRSLTQALPVVEPHHHRREVTYARRRYNPVHWDFLQWLLALAFGLALAATLGTWLHDLATPYLQWWSWLWWLVIFLIGFLGGGFVGSFWDRHEREHDETIAVRREQEHDDRTVVRARA